MNLPKHLAVHISHNQHKVYYETVEQYLDRDDLDRSECSPDDRAAMVAADSIWEIQWYPNTPVGFNIVYAATLERALELANNEEATLHEEKIRVRELLAIEPEWRTDEQKLELDRLLVGTSVARRRADGTHEHIPIADVIISTRKPK